MIENLFTIIPDGADYARKFQARFQKETEEAAHNLAEQLVRAYLRLADTITNIM